jgi:uncharacterized protein
MHPSIQVGQYQRYLEDTHPVFYSPPHPISLSSCVYLHNHHSKKNDILFSYKFSEATKFNPLFSADDVDGIKRFLTRRLINGEGNSLLKSIEETRFRPSKKLMDHVYNVIKRKKEYILLNEQLFVYDGLFTCVKKGFHHKKKTIFIVNGGPETGKSVVALNLMSDLLREGINAQYATGSKAFREKLRKVIGTRGGVLFKDFNSYQHAEYNSIDVLICDESHRIREHSHNMYTPNNHRSNRLQIEELINTAKVCVFFIDDGQVLLPTEIGSTKYIIDFASQKDIEINNYKLEIPFRCAGSEADVNWIDSLNWINNWLDDDDT